MKTARDLIILGIIVILSGCGTSEKGYFEDAQAKIENEDYAGAIMLLDQAIAENDEHADAFVARATCKMRLNNFEAALSDYNKGISLVKGGAVLPEVYFNRGEVLQALEKFDSAMMDFTMAMSLKPDFALAYCRRGVALASVGLMDSARADLAHALSIDPQLAEAYYEMANTFADADHNQAIALYTQALALEENPYYYFNRGLMHYMQSSYAKAIDDFSSAIRIDNKMVSAFELRGNAYDESGMAQEAVRDFDQALAIDPNYASAYFNRGITRNNQGDKAGACDDFKKALELGYVEALTRTGDCD